jgi:hypothetical protein
VRLQAARGCGPLTVGTYCQRRPHCTLDTRLQTVSEPSCLIQVNLAETLSNRALLLRFRAVRRSDGMALATSCFTPKVSRWSAAPLAASPYDEPAAQDAGRLQHLDGDVDRVGAKILEPANLKVLTHRGLRR